MTQGFYEYHNKQKYHHDNIDDSIARQYYQAGVQSRQDEVDATHQRIDGALRHLVDHGGYDDLTHVINILKGEVK